jgi:hypothetical protein
LQNKKEPKGSFFNGDDGDDGDALREQDSKLYRGNARLPFQFQQWCD